MLSLWEGEGGTLCISVFLYHNYVGEYPTGQERLGTRSPAVSEGGGGGEDSGGGSG